MTRGALSPVTTWADMPGVLQKQDAAQWLVSLGAEEICRCAKQAKQCMSLLGVDAVSDNGCYNNGNF